MAIRPLADTLSGRALADYQAGRLLLGDGDFEGALTKFRSAHELQGDPRLLWNMAACEKNLRRYRKVRELTQAYLAKGESAGLLTDRDRRDARDLLALLRTLIGSIRLNVSEPGVTVLVDNEEVGVTPIGGDLEADIGPRTIAFRKQGFRALTLSREVRGGEPLILDVDLERAESVLVVKADPSTAIISLDGKPVGTGVWSGKVSPGRLLVRVAAPDRRPYEIELALEDRQTRELSAKLEREASSSRWWWGVGATAVVSAAAVGAYFLFKPRAADTVPGSLGEVALPLRGSP